jgi:hypothetical protein
LRWLAEIKLKLGVCLFKLTLSLPVSACSIEHLEQ